MNCFLFTNPSIHQSSNPPNSVRDSLWCFDTHRLRCFHNQNGNCAVGDVQASVFAAPACANLQVSLLTAACWKDSSIHYTNIQKQCIDCIDICMYMMRTDTSSFTCIVCIVVHMDLDIYYIIRHIRISLYIYHIYLYHIYIYICDQIGRIFLWPLHGRSGVHLFPRSESSHRVGVLLRSASLQGRNLATCRHVHIKSAHPGPRWHQVTSGVSMYE